MKISPLVNECEMEDQLSSIENYSIYIFKMRKMKGKKIN